MRTKDRLQELTQRIAANGSGLDDGVYQETVELVTSDDTPATLDKEIEDIFEEVDRTRAWIYELENKTQLMRRLLADPTFHNNKHLQEQLDAAITTSNATGLKVCGALRQLETRATRRNARTTTIGVGSGVRTRIARLQYAATRQLYAEALDRQHTLLQALRDHRLQLLHEQMRLTNLTVSDEECQALLDNDNIALFVDNVRAETAEARRALREVEARHEELTRVESSLREVRDLFTQLAFLVAQQQDQIDTVEYYALQASEHVEEGGRELMKGTVSRRKAKKKKYGLILCLVSGFVIVLLVLIYT